MKRTSGGRFPNSSATEERVEPDDPCRISPALRMYASCLNLISTTGVKR